MSSRRPPGSPKAEEHTEVTQRKAVPERPEHTVLAERPGPDGLPFQTGTSLAVDAGSSGDLGERTATSEDLPAHEGGEGRPEYRTTGAYRPVGDAGVDGLSQGTDGEALSGATSSPEEDIYGEDDALPEGDDDGDDEAPLPVVREPSQTRARRVDTQRVPVPAEAGGDAQAEEADDSTHIGRPVKLEVIQGPDSGRVKRFNGVRMVVGRAPGVELRLTDAAVSRRHVELVQGDEGVLLRDLGSGNGTRVNDDKVTERILQHLDEIALGKTVLRFYDASAAARLREEELARQAALERAAADEEAVRAAEEAAVASLGGGEPSPPPEDVEPAAPATADAAPEPLRDAGTLAGFGEVVRRARERWEGWPPKRRWLVAFGAGVGLLSLLVGGLHVAGRSDARASPRPWLEKLEDARAAMVSERFGDAITLLGEAEALQPKSDPQGLVHLLQNELDAEEALLRVKSLRDAGRYAEAREALALVPEASPRLDAVRERFSGELEQQQLSATQQSLSEALARGDVVAARGWVELLPVPLQAEASARVDRAQAEWKARRTAAEQRAAEAREGAERRKRVQRKAFLASAFSAVERKFDAGDYSRAVLECDRVLEQHPGDAEVVEHAQALKNLIPAFVAAYDDAERKLKAGGGEVAVRSLRRARELYARIGFGGALGGIIDGKLTAAALQAAKLQLARNDLVGALNHFREASRLSPGDERAQLGVAQIAKHGDRLLQEANAERERDPRAAAAKLRIVLEVTAPGSEPNRQARALLSNLSP